MVCAPASRGRQDKGNPADHAPCRCPAVRRGCGLVSLVPSNRSWWVVRLPLPRAACHRGIPSGPSRWYTPARKARRPSARWGAPSWGLTPDAGMALAAGIAMHPEPRDHRRRCASPTRTPAPDRVRSMATCWRVLVASAIPAYMRVRPVSWPADSPASASLSGSREPAPPPLSQP